MRSNLGAIDEVSDTRNLSNVVEKSAKSANQDADFALEAAALARAQSAAGRNCDAGPGQRGKERTQPLGLISTPNPQGPVTDRPFFLQTTALVPDFLA